MARRIAFIALLSALAVHLLLGLGVLPVPGAVANAVYVAIEVAAIVLVTARAVAVPRNRTGWSLVALALTSWLAGDVVWNIGPQDLGNALYLVTFAGLYAALAVLLRDRVRPFPVWLLIDGLLAGLTLAALASTVFAPVREATQGDTRVVAGTLANLGCDIVLLVAVLVGFAATAWRPGRSWWLLGVGFAACGIGDAIYVYQEAAGTYAAGTWLDSLWAGAIAATALAAWQRTERPSRAHVGWGMAVIPLGASAISISTLLYAGLTGGAAVTVVLAAAALFAAIARAVLMLAENFRLLHKARREALTDKLTALPNRRALVHDLDRACASGHPHTLVFFDLDGFKDYNDAFGHPAGDALLGRLAPALASVGGRAYRLGGDEFCLLLDGSVADDAPLVERAVAALSARGDGFSIGASYGLVVLPEDAADATEALRLADERMYARKRRRRGGSRSQARDLLVKVMAEREPDLDTHNSRVAVLSEAVGRRLGLDAEALDVLIRAAELHDVGKVAVPDGILYKPGPLDDGEWAVMRQHTVAGERILGVTDSMRPVARVVRASHERWDGGGYPEGLAGEAIPLEARIVCACDAYDAMLSERAYKAAMTPAAAIAELRRCAGTQFDPRVVEVLAEVALSVAVPAS